MTPTRCRMLLAALGLGVALTHAGCSYELVLETVSGRTTFEQGETVVIEVFDGKDRIRESMLGGARIRWSVRNLSVDTGYRDVGYGDELITSQLAPGRNLVYAEVEGSTDYPLLGYTGGITIKVTANGVLPPDAPAPEPAAPEPQPEPQPQPDPPASSSSSSSSSPPAPATSGLVGGLGGAH